MGIIVNRYKDPGSLLNNQDSMESTGGKLIPGNEFFTFRGCIKLGSALPLYDCTILLMATRNPANSPLDMVNVPLFTGFYLSQLDYHLIELQE